MAVRGRRFDHRLRCRGPQELAAYNLPAARSLAALPIVENTSMVQLFTVHELIRRDRAVDKEA